MKYFAFHSMLQPRMVILACAALIFCVACSEEAEVAGSKPAGSVYITGGMKGEDGPIKEAELTATDSNGSVIATLNVSGKSRYSLELPAGTDYPVIISAIYPRSTKVDESGAGEVKAAVMEPSSSSVDLSPTSTAIVDIAQARGGLTPENFEQASAAALNLGRSGSGGSPYQGGHH
jgi:hypothetical protein